MTFRMKGIVLPPGEIVGLIDNYEPGSIYHLRLLNMSNHAVTSGVDLAWWVGGDKLDLRSWPPINACQFHSTETFNIPVDFPNFKAQMYARCMPIEEEWAVEPSAGVYLEYMYWTS